MKKIKPRARSANYLSGTESIKITHYRTDRIQFQIQFEITINDEKIYFLTNSTISQKGFNANQAFKCIYKFLQRDGNHLRNDFHFSEVHGAMNRS